MSKRAFDSIGHALSVNLYNIGNRLNISGFKNINEKNRMKAMRNDKEALAEDWISIGKEVRLALDNLEKSPRQSD